MATSQTAQVTDFTRDVLGRYVCNGLDEAILSADPNPRPDLGRPFSRPDARPFDTIIIGGGTFGAALAQHLFFNDVSRSHRILVLEGGPFVLTEHNQNLPMIGMGVAAPSSIAALRAMTPQQQRAWSQEVWGIAWHSATAFPGLAYCIGGRSLFWGGWSPRLLPSEMPTSGPVPNLWPVSVVTDLNGTYFRQSSDQIGVSETNDFIYGPLQNALRQQLFAGIAKVGEAFPLNSLPDHPAVLFNPSPPTDQELLSWLGLPPGPPPPRQDLLNLLKLEAPLAVQSQTDPGAFPINKFSSVPLLIKATRQAFAESRGDDVNKRLMVVPFCHVKRLLLTAGQVSSVDTNQGPISVAPGAVVIIALGTIESTRLALNSFQGIANYHLIGRNLMAHLRSNLTIRIPRTALPAAATLPKALSVSALFVKGLHQGPNRAGTFHLQITASGLGAKGADAEAEMWQKVPDIDQINDLRAADDTTVVITIRGIAEMEPQNSGNSVRLDPNLDADEYVVPRAFVTFTPSTTDMDLWDAMDIASDEVAKVFANNQPFELATAGGFVKVLPGDDLRAKVPYTFANDPVNPGRRDRLGTTHHEAGTLWMGDSAASSVTNGEGRLHQVGNAYVLGPALFPTIGSPNPMLTGIALARRLADRLIAPPPPLPSDPGFTFLFDGTDKMFNQWRFAGGGSFARNGRGLVAQPGSEIGLLYFPQAFGDFTLKMDFMLAHPRGNNNDNSGVFVRFQDPTLPVPDRNNPTIKYPYINQAFVAVDTGFEVQIDEEARGDTRFQEPDGFFYNRTGAIYKIKDLGTQPGQQNYQNTQQLSAGQWNQYEIQVSGDRYTVLLNGQPCTDFVNTDTFRGKSPGFIGLQTHTGRVAFANVRIK